MSIDAFRLWWCLIHGAPGDETSCYALGFRRSGENCDMHQFDAIPVEETNDE